MCFQGHTQSDHWEYFWELTHTSRAFIGSTNGAVMCVSSLLWPPLYPGPEAHSSTTAARVWPFWRAWWIGFPCHMRTVFTLTKQTCCCDKCHVQLGWTKSGIRLQQNFLRKSRLNVAGCDLSTLKRVWPMCAVFVSFLRTVPPSFYHSLVVAPTRKWRFLGHTKLFPFLKKYPGTPAVCVSVCLSAPLPVWHWSTLYQCGM